jgi:hypothetical protein
LHQDGFLSAWRMSVHDLHAKTQDVWIHKNGGIMPGKQRNKSDQKSKVIDADKFIRDYYEKGIPSDSEGFRDPLETVSTPRRWMSEHPNADDAQRIVELSGGDPDALSLEVDSGEETPGGSAPTPDQDIVDEIGAAAGITYQDTEPLKMKEKSRGRDESRWELDPASSEDYRERQIDTARDARSPVQSPAKATGRRKASKSKSHSKRT